MIINVDKDELLGLLAEMNNGALDLPPSGIRRMIQFGDAYQPFELYVNNLMARVATMLNPNVVEQTLPTKLVPVRIVVDKLK